MKQYIQKHWRGELNPKQTLLYNGILIPMLFTVLSIVIAITAAWIFSTHSHNVIIIIWIISLCMILPSQFVFIWSSVGMFRFYLNFLHNKSKPRKHKNMLIAAAVILVVYQVYSMTTGIVSLKQIIFDLPHINLRSNKNA